MALAGAHWGRLSSFVSASTAVLGGGLLAYAFLRFDETTTFPGLPVLVPVTGAALLIVGGATPHRWRPNRLLEVRALTAIGDVSYGWYLWHWPLIVMAAALVPQSSVAKPAAAAVSLPVAMWMDRRFENPIRRASPGSSRRTLRLAAVCIVVPLLAGGVLEIGHAELYEHGAPPRFEGHADALDGCMTTTMLAKPPRHGCVQHAIQPKGLTVLIGDSNAGQFTEGFMAAAAASHLDARVATRGSCPFTDLRVLDDLDATQCYPIVDESIANLVALKPAVVFIARNSDGYIEAPCFRIAAADGSLTDTDPRDKAIAWRDADERMVRRLDAAGIRVVLIAPVPKFPGWDTVDMAPLRLMLPVQWLDQTYPRAFALSARQKAVEAEQAAAASKGAQVIDFFDELCPGDPCHTNAGGRASYLDGGHISVQSARRLEPAFDRAMSQT